MSDSERQNLPAKIADAISGIPSALVPASIKALDRLIGAAVDIPIAWLAQQKAKIDAQTGSFQEVEAAISGAAAIEASGDKSTIDRAVNVLVRKAYRTQVNREAVAAAMIEDLQTAPATGEQPTEVADDWLNVFERYAEDASSERMQQLWGRVLSGEVRRPGRFAPRTLRFLSEFSQADALTFEHFCKGAFGDTAPQALAKPETKKDQRDLIYLEATGLIQGASGLGLQQTLHFNKDGRAVIREGDFALVLMGAPQTSIAHSVIALTPLGQELITLLPGRDAREAAKAVAEAIRTPQIKEAYLADVDEAGFLKTPMEVLWIEEKPTQGT